MTNRAKLKKQQRMEGTKENSVAKLRSALSDVLTEDIVDEDLTKWLIARNFDVAMAEAMYRDSLRYKKKMHVDTIFYTYKIHEPLVKYFPGGFVGFDPNGCPVVVELFGHYDMEGIMRSSRRSDLERIKLFQCESTLRFWRDQSKKLGKRIDGLTVIFDMEGVSTKFLWRPGLDMYLSLVKLLEDNYPEMLKRLCVVNAPIIFPYLWNLVTPLVSAEMKQKIIVLKKDESAQKLLEYVGKDCLPAYLGGKLTDPDGNPRCLTMINQGGMVPDSYYLKPDPSLTTVIIGRREDYVVWVDVLAMDTLLCWEFRTDDHDLGFEIKFVGKEKIDENENRHNDQHDANEVIGDVTNLADHGDSDGERVDNDNVNNNDYDDYSNASNCDKRDSNKNYIVIVAKQRYSCDYLVEDGCHLCEVLGKYKVTFDNTYSWTKSKTLRYKVWTEPFKRVHASAINKSTIDRFNEVFNTKNYH